MLVDDGDYWSIRRAWRYLWEFREGEKRHDVVVVMFWLLYLRDPLIIKVNYMLKCSGSIK